MQVKQCTCGSNFSQCDFSSWAFRRVALQKPSVLRRPSCGLALAMHTVDSMELSFGQTSMCPMVVSAIVSSTSNELTFRFYIEIHAPCWSELTLTLFTLLFLLATHRSRVFQLMCAVIGGRPCRLLPPWKLPMNSHLFSSMPMLILDLVISDMSWHMVSSRPPTQTFWEPFCVHKISACLWQVHITKAELTPGSAQLACIPTALIMFAFHVGASTIARIPACWRILTLAMVALIIMQLLCSLNGRSGLFHEPLHLQRPNPKPFAVPRWRVSMCIKCCKTMSRLIGNMMSSTKLKTSTGTWPMALRRVAQDPREDLRRPSSLILSGIWGFASWKGASSSKNWNLAEDLNSCVCAFLPLRMFPLRTPVMPSGDMTLGYYAARFGFSVICTKPLGNWEWNSKRPRQLNCKRFFNHYHLTLLPRRFCMNWNKWLVPQTFARCTRKLCPSYEMIKGRFVVVQKKLWTPGSPFSCWWRGGNVWLQIKRWSEWLDDLASFRASSLDLTLADLPSLCELECAYRRVKPGKATGPDGIDALLCHLSPADFAKKTYSLMLKTLTHGQESLLHKGGRLHPLWKGKGAKDSGAAYRSILVSSHIGKTIHRCLRVHSADLFERYLQKQQLGGKRRISVATGVHQARAFLRSRRQRGLNVGMVFLDLCEAFYRIVRELAIGGPACDETIAKMGHRLGMGEDLLYALYRHLDDEHALARAGLSRQMQMVVRSLHADTHFSLQGQEDRCKTRLGTRPGDSWADLIFSFLSARLLHDLEAEFQEAGLIDNVPAELGLRSSLLPCTTEHPSCTMTVGFIGPTWMDDSVFCFADPHADALERKAAHLCGLLLQKCKEFAMTPNLSPGKTAAMLVFQGPGSVAAKKRIFGPSAPKLLTILTEYDAQQVHVVTTYTHLGCLLHHKGDMRQEARRRFSIAQTAFQQHRRLLYQNKHLSLRRRAELFRTLILSKFVYGCESWTLADARTRHFVHTSLIKLYKRLIHRAHESHLTDEEVLRATGLPDPSTLLRMQRLRHLGALYATADSSAWGVLNEDFEWISLICSDLDWMWTQLRGSSDLQDPKRHLASWTYLMLHHRNYWKKLILRAGAHAAAQRDNLYDVQCFHRNILSQLHEHGSLVSPPPYEIKQFPKEIFACMACEKRFPSRGGCGAHMFRSHGVFQTVRNLFDGTQCACCLKEFHSYGKLQGHLLRAEFCRRSLQRKGIHVAPVPGIGSISNGHLERAHDCVLPPLQAQGPLPAPGRRAEHDDYDLILFEELYTIMLDATGIEDSFQQLKLCIQGRVITWERLLLTLRALRDEATPADVEALPISNEAFHLLLGRLEDPHTWPFLTQDTVIFEGHWNRDVQDLAEYCCREADAADEHRLPDQVPRGFGCERYFLHLFSGRRRKGDFQFFFDRLRDTSEGILIHIISLDVVLSSAWGDLLKPSAREFWRDAIRLRLVAGLIGGPPCETWSQARERSVDAHGRAPRVLRTAEYPWGKEALRLRELLQLSVGNSLMGFQLEAVVALYCVGGIALTEHPAPPKAESSVSIWRTPILKLLLSLPGFELLHLAQGLWGAKSPKPTSLLVLNAPGIQQDLLQWQVTKEVPVQTSIGVDLAGGWSTAALKEYPPALNRALAQGLSKALRRCAVDETVQISQAFRDRCKPMLCTDYGGTIGPDFAG